MTGLSRRDMIRWTALVAAGSVAGCTLTSVGPLGDPQNGPDGRLTARPGATASGNVVAGTATIPETDAVRHGLCFVPSSYKPGTPLPLVVVFHGAGGDAGSLLTPLTPIAEELRVALLSIKSLDSTWDVIGRGVYGNDVYFLNLALTGLFGRIRIDPAKIGVLGFSDGATYALSLGRVNGDLFSRIVAFSPGGIAEGGTPTGKPSAFLTHGTNDTVLPVSITKNIIIPRLQQEGYTFQFHEFNGAHSVPASLVRDAMVWLNADR